MKLNGYLITVLFLFGTCITVVHGATFCTTQQNLLYSASTSPIDPMSDTATTPITNDNGTALLNGCTASWARVKYFVDSASDLDNSRGLTSGSYYFFKIKSINGVTSGDAATQYLIDHAYIAFSLADPIGGTISQPTQINQTSLSTTGTNILTSNGLYYQGSAGLGVYSIGMRMSSAKLYFDALPTLDTTIDLLNSKSFILDLGNPQISMATSKITSLLNNPNTNPEGSEYTNFNNLRLKLTIAKVQFNKPTCTILDKTVTLDTVSSVAFRSSQTGGISKAFDFKISCSGQLNSRNFSAKFVDNNTLTNINSIGYFTNASGSGYSNVGVQLTDSSGIPISVGNSINFLSNQSGSSFTKALKASYYLPSGSTALTGKVNAQAIVTVTYQ